MAYLAELFLPEGLGMNIWDRPIEIVVGQIADNVYMTFKIHFFTVRYNSFMASCKNLVKRCTPLERMKIKTRTTISPR